MSETPLTLSVLIMTINVSHLNHYNDTRFKFLMSVEAFPTSVTSSMRLKAVIQRKQIPSQQLPSARFRRIAPKVRQGKLISTQSQTQH